MRSRKYFYYFDDGYYPQDVANMGYNVWDWDASKLDTLFQDSLKTTPVASNSDPVGAWVDGVSGVDAVQATTANKPTYTTASLNGLPTLSFDGGDVLSNLSFSDFDDSYAVFAVAKYNNGSPLNQAIFDVNSGIVNTGFAFLTVTNGFYRPVGTGVTNIDLGNVRDGVWRAFRGETYTTNSRAYINNTLINTIGYTAPNPNTLNRIDIGGLVLGSYRLTGNIAHLCIVSPYPTPAIIAQMESYINGLWGVY